jgi:hypothetical protein
MYDTEELLNRKFTLQNDILASWTKLQTMQDVHTNLLQQLATVKEQLKRNTDPSLYEQLFGDVQ